MAEPHRPQEPGATQPLASLSDALTADDGQPATLSLGLPLLPEDTGGGATTFPGAAAPATVGFPVVPGYEILRELGRGGMGVVYLARQSRLHRLVALKMVRGSLYAGDDGRQRFLLEAEALAQLHHPNIVQIYELGMAGEDPFFALEYVEGESLAARLTGRPLPPRVAAELAAALAAAIHTAHAKGIVHRDLKPANILLAVSRDAQRSAADPALLSESRLNMGTAKIADFGLAKLLGRDEEAARGFTASGDVLGTPAYMAPEQAAGKIKEIGPGTDIHALGAIFYETLTGRPPFQGATAIDTALMVIKQEPVPPLRLLPTLPPDLNTICLKCLEKEPAKRYPSAQALADDLRRWLAGEPIHARPVGAAEKAWKWAKRRPAAAALLALSAVGVIALLAAGIAYDATIRRHNRELGEANKIVEAEKNAALAQRKQALAYFRNARAAMDKNVNGLLRDPALDRPEMKNLRAKLLEPAVDFYKQFTQTAADDAEVRRDLVGAQLTLGDLYFRTGKVDLSTAAFKEAVRLADATLAAAPQDREAQALAGRAHYKLGEFGTWVGRTTEAQQAFRRAIGLQEKALAADATNDAVRFDLARTNRELGMLLRNAGEMGFAEEVQAKAFALQSELVAKRPNQPEYLQALALSHMDQGINAMFRDDHAKAEPAYQAAAGLRKKLLEIDPKNLSYRYAWAEILYSLGMCAEARGQRDKAEEQYREAVRVGEGIVADKPSDIEFKTALGLGYQKLAILHARGGRHEEAEAEYRKAIAIHDPLRKASPNMAELHIWSMQAWANLAILLNQTDRTEESAKALEEAIAAARAVPKEESRYEQTQGTLGALMAQRAMALGKLGRHAEALAGWEEMEKKAPPRVRQALRVDKAVTLAHLGKAREAAAAVDEAMKGALAPPSLYNAACAYSLASAHVPNEEKSAYLGKAIDLLRRCEQTGFFKSRPNLDNLLADTDLKPLRGHPGYEAFVGGLKK